MKTKSILDKYRKIIAGILKVEDTEIQFWCGNHCLTPFNFDNFINNKFPTLFQDLREIGELVYEKKSDEFVHNWCCGKYSIVLKGKALIGTFELYQLPHCCAVLVSCKAFVNDDFRNKRIGTILNSLRQDIGRQLGYSLLMCTDIDSNECQRKLLATNGWKDIHSIKNKRTNNTVYLSVINL